MILDLLKKLELHDAPVKTLSFDFEKRECLFVFEQYDDLAEDYVPLSILFEGVHKFLSHYPAQMRFEVSACKTFKVWESAEGLYEIKFVLEIDDEIPAYTLQIGFMGVQVSGGRSMEAQADREEYFRNEVLRLAQEPDQQAG